MALTTLRRPTRTALANGMLALALVLLVVALLDPVLPRRGRDVDVVFVVDASASMGPAGREEALAWVAEAATSRARDDRAGVVLVGADAQVGHRLTTDPPPGLPPVVVDEGATDLERGVRLAAGLLGDANRRRVVLVTDGRATRGNLDQAAAALADTGIGLDVVTVGRAGVADVLVAGVRSPAGVREGESYAIDVDLRNDTDRPAAGVLEVRAAGEVIAEQAVDLPTGTTTITVDHVAGEGPVEDISVALRSGDSTVTRNDTGAAAVRVAGPPRMLLMAREALAAAPLQEALEAGGVVVDAVPAAEGVPSVADLSTVDAVVLVDVPATMLGDAGIGRLDQAVRDGGVGLVTVGGDQSYGLGDYDASPLEDLLPVSSRVSDPLRRPTVAEALVVDSSESMGACHCADEGMGGMQEDPGAVNKTEIARQAVRRAVQQLDAGDTVGVLAFDTASRWVLPLQQVPAASVVEEGLAQLHPSGNTDIPQAVRMAIEGLRNADAELRHIVLFSDGFMGDLSGLVPVAEEARSAGITLSVVGTGEGSFPELADMADVGGGRYYPGRNLAEIPDILAAEVVQVARPLVNEGEFVPTVAGIAPATEDLDASPALAGYVTTTAKPTARRLLTVGEFTDPLLATWQAGLGTVTAWTSDASARWSAQWVGWDGYAGFWADVVKATFPDATADSIDAAVEVGARDLRITADLPSDGGREQVTATRDPAGGFSAVLPAQADGVYLVTVEARDAEGEAIGRAVVPAVRTYPAEFGAIPADTASLERSVTVAGGALDPDPAGAFRRDGLAPGSRGVRVWAWLTVTALLLGVAGVGVGRLRLRREDLPRLRRPTRATPPPSGRMPRSGGTPTPPPPGPALAPAPPSAPTPDPSPAPADPAEEEGGLAAARRARDRAQRRPW